MNRTQQFAIVGLVLSALAAPAGAEGFVLIRNAKSPSTVLSKSDVRAIYTGKSKMFGNDVAVVVVPTDDTPAFSGFADQVFGTNTKTLLTKIKQEVFKGEMSKPFKAAADDDVVHLVAGTVGAIGVISAPTAKGLPASVAVIAIGG